MNHSYKNGKKRHFGVKLIAAVLSTVMLSAAVVYAEDDVAWESAASSEYERDIEKGASVAPAAESGKLSSTDNESGDSALIEDFTLIYQMPELPTGCEITAFTMALNYYGFDVDKITMAAEFLPTASYGGDLNNYFIGDPFSSNGVTCGTGAIVTAGNDYLATQDTDLETVDISGSTAEELYERVSNGQPVVVWVTIYMADRSSTQGWYTSDGEWVDWASNDHGAVLIGYTDTTVTIADPISGIVEYDREQFESVYASRGSHAVVIE